MKQHLRKKFSIPHLVFEPDPASSNHLTHKKIAPDVAMISFLCNEQPVFIQIKSRFLNYNHNY